MVVELLKVSPANAKLESLLRKVRKWLQNPRTGAKRKVYSIDLTSGHTCPYADKCKSMAVEIGEGKYKIEDGPNCEVRCFSASQEVVFPAVRRAREHNTSLIRAAKTEARIAKLILASLPLNVGVVRYHVGGDFFSMAYFRAAIRVALARPDVLFYGYTKNIPALLKCQDDIPDNFRMVASYGGKRDDLIPQYRGVSARWVYSISEAKSLGLPIDHDDSHAAIPTRDFCLLLHGIQPKGSKAGEAKKQLKRENIKHSYGRKGGR
jgi:hypothetical protein